MSADFEEGGNKPTIAEEEEHGSNRATPKSDKKAKGTI